MEGVLVLVVIMVCIVGESNCFFPISTVLYVAIGFLCFAVLFLFVVILFISIAVIRLKKILR